jgi:hypothetical protein
LPFNFLLHEPALKNKVDQKLFEVQFSYKNYSEKVHFDLTDPAHRLSDTSALVDLENGVLCFTIQRYCHQKHKNVSMCHVKYEYVRIVLYIKALAGFSSKSLIYQFKEYAVSTKFYGSV